MYASITVKTRPSLSRTHTRTLYTHTGYLPQDSAALAGSTARASAYVYASITDDLYGEWCIDKFLASEVWCVAGICNRHFLK